MGDSASESYFQPDALGLRHLSSSFFNIPSFLIGFSSRGSSDSDSAKSPTSPLDFNFFSNLSNPFSHRSPKSQSQNGHLKKWDCNKVGLGIVNLLADETKPAGEVLDSPDSKNIIFGPQVKTVICVRSSSLPKEYTVLPPSQTKPPEPILGKLDAIFGNEGLPFECELHRNSSLVTLTPKPHLCSCKFGLEHKVTAMPSLPLVIGGDSQIDNSLDVKPSSLPIPIDSSNGFVGSLSAREIELSEDYTCIISHGPNPKTTHIFGDCILEGHTNEFSDFEKGDLGFELPQEAKHPQGPTPCSSDEILSFCHSCKKNLEKNDDIYIYRGDKAFCSFDCRSKEIISEEEAANAFDNSSKSSPGSSYNGDLFLIEREYRADVNK